MPNFAVTKNGLVAKHGETFSYRQLPVGEAQARRNQRARELRREGYKVTCYSYSEFCGLEYWRE